MKNRASTELAATYERISDDREGRELGVERQRKDNRSLAQREGLTVVSTTYTDNDLSASTKARKERPAYQRLLADAKAGKFKVIIAYTSARLTRKPREREDLIELAQKYGVRFLYIKSPSFDLNTASGRTIARVLSDVETGEAEEIAERVRDEVRHRAERGDFHGGPRGYGLESDGCTIREDEAERIRQWAAHVLAGGSLRSLATELNAAGVPTARGTAWRGEVIRKILLAPRIAGLRIHDGVEYPSWSPEIVKPATWRALKVLLEASDRQVSRDTARKWLGVSLFTCKRCEGQHVKSHYTRHGDRAYACPTCHRSWRAEPIDSYILDLVEGILAKQDKKARVLPRMAEGVNFAELEAEAAAIRVNMAELATQFALARGAVKAALSIGLEAGEKRLSEIDAELVDGAEVDPVAELGSDDPVKAFRDLKDLGRRQAVIRSLMSVVLGAPIRGRAKWDPLKFIEVKPVR